MNYDEALAYWYAHANFEQRAPAPVELKLDRMRALLTRLGNPHHRLRVLHVAGSKGKGSTSAMLAEVLTRAGYRTGLFTSPHLSSVEERFLVDGRPIFPAELAQLLTELRDILGKGLKTGWEPPTFFELATAVGFLHFVRRRVDVAVLEVGLGGRLDSTNVCRPELAIITSISFDHTGILGDRLAQIAAEKAGIIKKGRPAVSGAVAPEARAVIERTCRDRRAALRQLGIDFRYRYRPGQVSPAGRTRPGVTVLTRSRAWPEMELSLLGEHQAANAAVAVACVEWLRELGWHIPDAAVAQGLREVAWPARLEVFPGSPMLVLDCAHNVASARALVDTLRQSFPPGRRVLVFAGSGDKDIAGMFEELAPAFEQVFLTRFARNLRSLPPESLQKMWLAAGGGAATVCATPAEALASARSAALSPDEGLVCVTGSVFLAGEVRPQLLAQP
jgi:dihydrofolate synthase/folylpolyglutamate synthase